MGFVYTRGTDGRIYPSGDPGFPVLTGSLLSLDIETTGRDYQRDSIVCIALNDGTAEYVVDVRGLDRALVADWIENHLYRNRTLLGHNLAFDLAFLREHYVTSYPASTSIHDTMVCEQICTAGLRQEVGLDDVCLRRLGVLLDKSLQTSFNATEPLSELQTTYALHDVGHLFDIRSQQLREVEEYELGTVYAIEMADVIVFSEMQRRGLGKDDTRLEKLLDTTRTKRDLLRSSLQLILTPHVEWLRIEKEDAEKQELKEWLTLYEKEKKNLERSWFIQTEDYFEGVSSCLDWDESWFDQELDKKDQLPKGMKRYVKYHLSAKPGMFRDLHPRPKKPSRDTEPINLNSSQQLLAALHNMKIFPVDQNDKPTTSSAALAGLLVEDQPEEIEHLLLELIEYRRAEKILQSFGETLIEKTGIDGRLHCSVNQCVSTGRPSFREPNLGNMPKRSDFRRCFVPADGNVFIKADYNQIELRIAAQLSGDPGMIDAFRGGADVHEETKQEMGVSERRVAKTLNFGILYGMGGKRLKVTQAQQGVKMTLNDAYSAVKKWKTVRAHCATWILNKGQEALRSGYTTTALGRRRWFNVDTIEDDAQRYAIMREGANHPIQGTSADITKLAMWMINDALGATQRADPYGVIVMQVYDEILVECPRQNASYVKEVVERHMLIASDMVLKDVPSKVDAVITLSWSGDDAL